MRKVLWRGTGDLVFTDDGAPRPPVLRPDEVRVRVAAAGVCATDVHIVSGEVRFVEPPLVLGHEFAGVAEECGPAVTRVRPGDRVKCDSVCGCAACPWCASGATQFCPSGSEFGITRDGGWAEWVVAPERNLHPLPAAISDEVAAIMDVEVLGALRKAGIAPGETVAVFGPGPAGLIAAQLARLMGAGSVILCGTRPDRLRAGAELGATHTVDVTRRNPVEAIREIAGPDGAGLVFEAAGKRQSVLDALEAVRPQGKLVLYGVHGSPVPDVPLDRMVLKDLRVYGSLTNRTGWSDLIELVACGRLNLARLVTHTFPLDQAAAAWAASRDRASGCIKAVLRIS
jgi:threonine dehydrogenase-like Zn-dependent dehydrogenase